MMEDAGLPYMLTRVASTYAEQVTLFYQGRTGLDVVNSLRRSLGWPPLRPEQNKKVTWTLNSLHIVRMENDDPFDNCARAFDFAILKGPKVPTWELKVDINENDIPDYREAGILWEECGGVWGGRWSNPDYCHCQLLIL